MIKIITTSSPHYYRSSEIYMNKTIQPTPEEEEKKWSAVQRENPLIHSSLSAGPSGPRVVSHPFSPWSIYDDAVRGLISQSAGELPRDKQQQPGSRGIGIRPSRLA